MNNKVVIIVNQWNDERKYDGYELLFVMLYDSS